MPRLKRIAINGGLIRFPKWSICDEEFVLNEIFPESSSRSALGTMSRLTSMRIPRMKSLGLLGSLLKRGWIREFENNSAPKKRSYLRVKIYSMLIGYLNLNPYYDMKLALMCFKVRTIPCL